MSPFLIFFIIVFIIGIIIFVVWNFDLITPLGSLNSTSINKSDFYFDKAYDKDLKVLITIEQNNSFYKIDEFTSKSQRTIKSLVPVNYTFFVFSSECYLQKVLPLGINVQIDCLKKANLSITLDNPNLDIGDHIVSIALLSKEGYLRDARLCLDWTSPILTVRIKENLIEEFMNNQTRCYNLGDLEFANQKVYNYSLFYTSLSPQDYDYIKLTIIDRDYDPDNLDGMMYFTNNKGEDLGIKNIEINLKKND